MKAVIAVGFLLASTLCFTPAAKAWNCSDPLAERVQVAPTTTGVFGDGDGQLANYGGELYECEVVPKTPPPTTTGGNSNASSNSSSNAAASSSSQAASNSASNSSATGGASSSKSTATGGNATGGNSVSGVSNSGNSSVSNNVTANGGAGGAGGSAVAKGGNQKQTQSQSLANSGNSAATASGNGVGNGNNSDDSSTVINEPRQVATAMAPMVLPTVPCFKGASGGAQGTMFGMSFSGGKIDDNCGRLEASRLAPSVIARCKIFITNKYAKEAGVTLEDCLPKPEPAKPMFLRESAPVLAPAPVINVSIPPAQVVVIPTPAPPPASSVVVAARKYGHTKSTCNPSVPKGTNPCVPKKITNDNIK